MPTLSNRPNSALLVIDVQTGVVAEGHARDAVVANIATLVDQARGADVPVIWIQHSDKQLIEGSPEWHIAPELEPAATEPLIPKNWGDSFEETDLEAVLADLGVGHLYISGAQTDACIRSTLHGALARGYDTTLVGDAHTTEDTSKWGSPSPDLVIAHTNLYWSHHAAPGRDCATVMTADVDFGS
ncbi:isochorismatase family protein [Stackebrandtia nassauensis]|uniref:Isochorismatase hydrolase n=1 Tax=Stackebrandtia nassauensis (strain DSM 44728 / CIP 108903 / NRRL B-16338 / NBRC 102104 / LLR-40K-21) TaxID=446470 RepID=D3Q5Q5_STANL|nr:isochorismatase family protein [Stackebrandtia nassauensis]ADD40204.1 isochorismatase hydrolase [Stackebrandtia nassauensis DSM 44728]